MKQCTIISKGTDIVYLMAFKSHFNINNGIS